MCDWEGCTTGTIGLPNPNRRSVVRTSGFLHPYIYRYTARLPRDRFLVLEGEGITWMGQPSCQGIALFSVRIELLQDLVAGKADAYHTYRRLYLVWCANNAALQELRPLFRMAGIEPDGRISVTVEFREKVLSTARTILLQLSD
jgi:hypothetical protein